MWLDRHFTPFALKQGLFTIDLNALYAAHQTALFAATNATDKTHRHRQNDKAAALALQIGRNRLNLGAAAACAWSTSERSLRPAADVMLKDA